MGQREAQSSVSRQARVRLVM